METLRDVVFLIDLDNTLLDNDRFGRDVDDRLRLVLGGAARDRYWGIYQELRRELGYADYLGALQRLRACVADDPGLLQISRFVLDYPFSDLVYPRVFDLIARLNKIGLTVVLSDGDIVFQPHKVQRSGIWDAVEGHVMICLHKERTLDAVQARYPAPRYVAVDDKPQLLATMKTQLRESLTTVFVRQGHYAAESERETIDPGPDRTLDRIGDLLDSDLSFISP